jgi:hypothetical protein
MSTAIDLPVPFTYAERLWTGATVGRASGGVLADAQREAAAERVYGAMYTYVAGTIGELVDEAGQAETQRLRIKEIVRAMPWSDVELLAYRALAAGSGQDVVEGFSQCPRCGKQAVTSDVLAELPVLSVDVDDRLTLSLQDPVEIVDVKKAPVIRVDVMTLRRPTIGDCMAANQSYGLADEVRLQYRVYVEAMEQINGEAVDRKTRDTWGMMMMERMSDRDLRTIGEWNMAAGMQTRVTRRCTRCDKTWPTEVSTMGFFASGLAR